MNKNVRASAAAKRLGGMGGQRELFGSTVLEPSVVYLVVKDLLLEMMVAVADRVTLAEDEVSQAVNRELTHQKLTFQHPAI